MWDRGYRCRDSVQYYDKPTWSWQLWLSHYTRLLLWGFTLFYTVDLIHCCWFVWLIATSSHFALWQYQLEMDKILWNSLEMAVCFFLGRAFCKVAHHCLFAMIIVLSMSHPVRFSDYSYVKYYSPIIRLYINNMELLGLHLVFMLNLYHGSCLVGFCYRILMFHPEF